MTTAIVDPVPSGGDSHWNEYCESDGVFQDPHCVELEVRRILEADPSVQDASVVVRRVGQGVCLEGSLVLKDRTLDVESLVCRVPGVQQVINHLRIVRELPPRKPRVSK